MNTHNSNILKLINKFNKVAVTKINTKKSIDSCTGFSLVVASWSCSLVAVHGVLFLIASLVEHRLSGSWFQ